MVADNASYCPLSNGRKTAGGLRTRFLSGKRASSARRLSSRARWQEESTFTARPRFVNSWWDFGISSSVRCSLLRAQNWKKARISILPSSRAGHRAALKRCCRRPHFDTRVYSGFYGRGGSRRIKVNGRPESTGGADVERAARTGSAQRCTGN